MHFIQTSHSLEEALMNFDPFTVSATLKLDGFMNNPSMASWFSWESFETIQLTGNPFLGYNSAMTNESANDTKRALQIIKIIADAIKDLNTVPSGHLYAQLMGHMSLETYEKCIGLLIKAKLVSQENNLLRWVG